MAALSEVVAHLEFLADTEDIKVEADGMISCVAAKKYNYVPIIDQMLAGPGQV